MVMSTILEEKIVHLAKWLITKDMKQADLARKMNVTQPCVHAWIYGVRPPNARHMMELYRMSGGKVGLKDWCEVFHDKQA